MQDFHFMTRLLAIIADFYFFTEHYFNNVIEATHQSLLCEEITAKGSQTICSPQLQSIPRP